MGHAEIVGNTSAYLVQDSWIEFLNENFAAILSGSSIGEVLRLGNYIGVSGKIRQFVAFRAGATEVARIKSRREQRVIRHTGFDRANFTGIVLGCIEAKFCK